ncbi:GDSL-type esterase/lipase family protein [Bacillus sp. JCM 19041]|uniref:GDSL-type esterase/lipase family protein n=1 Tax=Bacillus sp. JCM 19041 TaxID=1460637 RepID=UPI000A6049EC
MKVICFGDSITARYEGLTRPMLTEKLKYKLSIQTEIINAGVFGNNTIQALLRIEEDVLKHQPDFVTVLFGANDAAQHKMVPIDEFEKNIYKIVNLISPTRTILLTTAPIDEALQCNRTNALLNEYGDCIRRVAKLTKCHLIDFFFYFDRDQI